MLEEPKNKCMNMYYAYCMMPDLSVVFSGGCSIQEISAEVFRMQPMSAEIEYHYSMISERYMHGMIYVDGFVYVFGGVTNDGNTKKTEKWRFGSERWEECGDMNSEKVKPSVCLVGNRVFIGDENDIEAFDTETGVFTVLSVFKEMRYMIMVPRDNKILIFRKSSLYEVTLEPNFVTKQLGKIPILEYYSISQPLILGNMVYFLLDFDKYIYAYDLHMLDLSQVACVS